MLRVDRASTPAPAPQVIPIYGRGGNEDPRSKSKGDLEAVPQRPAGQRPAPVVRNPMLQPNLNVNAQQSGLGIIPTLFGLQNGNGGCLCCADGVWRRLPQGRLLWAPTPGAVLIFCLWGWGTLTHAQGCPR